MLYIVIDFNSFETYICLKVKLKFLDLCSHSVTSAYVTHKQCFTQTQKFWKVLSKKDGQSINFSLWISQKKKEKEKSDFAPPDNCYLIRSWHSLGSWAKKHFTFDSLEYTTM